ncbi:MAG: TonB-dependent receptor [Acidobacteriaceae bacterium]
MRLRLHMLAPLLALGSLSSFAQTRPLHVCVRDSGGRAIVAAKLTFDASTGGELRTGADGCALAEIPGGAVRLLTVHTGFAPATSPIPSATEMTVVLQPAAVAERVEVTAARTPLALDASASSVRSLSGRDLEEAPGFALDDRLRQVVGFQLFRRTGSWVANPTTEGTSLRGLGSTAPSRTLVLSDQVPLNDAFGGWIHWNEIPQLAMRSVELVRGGASDLYGSSAIGGVIEVLPVVPQVPGMAFDLAGATRDTFSLNALGTGAVGRGAGLIAASVFNTNGYILTAPKLRGLVDTSSNVHSESGRIELRRRFRGDGSAFLRGNLLNEARGNGTPVQRNATRLWRYGAGADWAAGDAGRFFVRGYGADEGYRQSFSSITPTRSAEQLTRLQKTPSQQLGGAAQWARSVRSLTLLAGADLLDTRGNDAETPVVRGIAQTTVSVSARQRDTGAYGELLWQAPGQGALAGGWSAALSGRVDRFRSFDARQAGGAPKPLPETSETVFSPRLGIVKQVGAGVSLTASVFRAFRGPTLYELYRTGQVGQQTTLANASLRSERATGFELGGLLASRRVGDIRASYFWTQVNRPVASVFLSSTPTSTLLERRNLGQLESRGLNAEWELRPASWIGVTGGYQLAISTVTRFQADPTLVGRWTAQVPRNSATLQLRLERRGLGVLVLDARTSGRQFDDSANTFQLHSFTQLNAYAEHAVGERWAVYASAQNLFDRSIEAGRTPVLTLGTPRTVLAGIRFRR